MHFFFFNFLIKFIEVAMVNKIIHVLYILVVPTGYYFQHSFFFRNIPVNSTHPSLSLEGKDTRPEKFSSLSIRGSVYYTTLNKVSTQGVIQTVLFTPGFPCALPSLNPLCLGHSYYTLPFPTLGCN